MKQFIVLIGCLAIMGAAAMAWAEPYRILHKQGAIYTLDSGWTLTTPPYYAGVDWAVDMVSDAQGVTILHKDGALWNDTGGWDLTTPPYYPGTNYARALDAGLGEVRRPISSLPYTISQSGSYYLTGDLTAPVDGGITVSANNVTIDLMGYSLIGPGSSYNNGVYMNGRSNVEIRNGTIRNFGNAGIVETSGTNHRIINVRAVGNDAYGIGLGGFGHLIKDCTASDNGLAGILAGSGSTVMGNTAYNNQDCGIDPGTNSLIDGNTAYGNCQSGGCSENISSCISCTWGVNHNPPITP